ncbi:MAG: sigma factor-like helix-turn-helix DNA-binding protein [Candidatus Enterosoma sp.]|nr:sigma factor-like helix-turn-helix DNA-binding protein [Candidatus Enterosoma sp.]
MTTKEYLERIGKLERKINAMKMRSQEYDRLSLSIPGPSYGERIGSNPNRNTEAPFLKWLIKKHDLDLEIEKLEKKLKDMQAEALLKIEELDNEDYKNVLVMRYIKGIEWKEISQSLYVSLSTVKRWHNEALDKIVV